MGLPWVTSRPVWNLLKFILSTEAEGYYTKEMHRDLVLSNSLIIHAVKGPINDDHLGQVDES